MTTQIVFDDRGKVYQRTPEPRHSASHDATAMILRAIAIVLLIAIAIIHVVQLVPTFRATPMLGVTFVLLIAGAVAAGGWLVKERQTAFRLWLPVAGLSVAALLGYGFTRMFSSPLDRVDVGNWSCELGMAALFVEGVLVAIALYAITLRPHSTEHSSPNTHTEIRIKSNGHVNGTRSVDVGGAPRST
jgi:hypothetical protein